MKTYFFAYHILGKRLALVILAWVRQVITVKYLVAMRRISLTGETLTAQFLILTLMSLSIFIDWLNSNSADLYASAFICIFLLTGQTLTF